MSACSRQLARFSFHKGTLCYHAGFHAGPHTLVSSPSQRALQIRCQHQCPSLRRVRLRKRLPRPLLSLVVSWTRPSTEASAELRPRAVTIRRSRASLMNERAFGATRFAALKFRLGKGRSRARTAESPRADSGAVADSFFLIGEG
jgi:hypothetical protein